MGTMLRSELIVLFALAEALGESVLVSVDIEGIDSN